METNDKNSRRKFIKNSILGTFLTLIGVRIKESNSDKGIINTPTNIKRINIYEEGKFPFFKYINDFNFGEFIPKDQGGKFVQMELLGTENDEEITKIINKEFIDKHLSVPNDWSIFEKSELEKSVWFNRFYYFPSFARLYFLDKNPNHLKFIMELLKNWLKENPLEGSSKSKYNWYDMQVAWRSINLSWFYYLGKDGLNNEEKEVIYNLQAQHAKVLMKDFGKKELNEFNHQSHGALAILYLAILFPSVDNASDLLNTSLKIINHHVEHAFYEDGGNVEQMFGYYPFISSVFRDVYLLCKENNVGDPNYIRPLLKKMYYYLSEIAQPDDTVPPINDSYEETVSFILLSLKRIIGFDNLPEIQNSYYFKDSQIAVLRSNDNSELKWYINFNAAKLIGSHSHAGRLSFNFWYNKRPILVDSGCCNYDNPLLVTWYRTSSAHNTVIIDEKLDHETSKKEIQWVAKRYTSNTINKFIVKDNFKLCRMISPASEETNSEVNWTRDVLLVADKYLVIHDFFDTETEHTYKTIFRFADLNLNVQPETNNIIIESDCRLKITPLTNAKSLELNIGENYLNKKAKNIITKTVHYNTLGHGRIHNSYIISPLSDNNKNNSNVICCSYFDDEKNYVIEINDSKKIKLVINEREIDLKLLPK